MIAKVHPNDCPDLCVNRWCEALSNLSGRGSARMGGRTSGFAYWFYDTLP